jgi:hypothetical protein
MQEQNRQTIVNGELAEIRDRLTTLETQMTERWDAHDKRSGENWTQIKAEMHLLFKKMEQIYNEQMDDKDKKIDYAQKESMEREERRSRCMNESKGYTNKIVGLAIGIPATVLGIYGVIMLLGRITMK